MNKKKFFILLIAGFLPSAQAAEWFVATDGDDVNAGTLAAPLRTIAEALDRAEPMDQIVLREGTYGEPVNIRKPRIIIRSHNGEWAHIAVPTDDPGIEQAVRFGYEAEQAQLIQVEVSGGYYYAVKLDSLWLVPPQDRRSADNVTVKHSYLHSSGRDVVKMTPGVFGAIIANNTIAYSGLRDDSNAECIDNVNADGARIYGNHIHDCATNGVYAKGGASGVVIEGNLVRNTGQAGIMLGYSGTDAEWFDADNTEYFENIEGIIRNNYVLDTQWAGIGLWGSLNARVYNNTLVNVAQASQEGILMSEGGPDAGNMNPNVNPDIRNNIVVLAAASNRGAIGSRADGLAGDWFIDYNAYHHEGGNLKFRFDGNPVASFAAWQAATGQETHSTTGDPLLDDNYHLTAASAALINMGLAPHASMEDYEGHARDDGMVDIGADEFNDSETLPIPPPEGVLGTGYFEFNSPQPIPVPDPDEDDGDDGNDGSDGDDGNDGDDGDDGDDTGGNPPSPTPPATPDSGSGGGVLFWLLALFPLRRLRR